MSEDATAREEEGEARRGWLKPLLKPLRPIFAEIAATSLFINILALAVPVFVLQVYDRVVLYAGFTTLQGLAIGMAFAIVFDFIPAAIAQPAVAARGAALRPGDGAAALR